MPFHDHDWDSTFLALPPLAAARPTHVRNCKGSRLLRECIRKLNSARRYRTGGSAEPPLQDAPSRGDKQVISSCVARRASPVRFVLAYKVRTQGIGLPVHSFGRLSSRTGTAFRAPSPAAACPLPRPASGIPPAGFREIRRWCLRCGTFAGLGLEMSRLQMPMLYRLQVQSAVPSREQWAMDRASQRSICVDGSTSCPHTSGDVRTFGGRPEVLMSEKL